MNSPLKIIKSFCLLFFSFFFLISFAEAATCGSANGTSTPAAPTTNLCSDGSLPHVDISGNSWAWTCGTTPCRAIDINAAYKSQFNATEMPTYTGSGSSPTTADIWLQYFCFSGFPTGLIAYQQYDLVSCSYGTMGSHGGCTSCVMSKYTIRKKGPTNGSCGSANGKNYAYNITSYGSDTQCASGTSTNTAFPAQGSSTSWTCSGSNGGSSANCSARRAAAPVNGRCGSSSNFCTAGTLLDTTDTAQNYTWTCLGLNGGANASCSIPKSYCSYAGPDNTSTTGTTHDVYVYGAVNTTSVWFPTWTNSNGQDDLKWYVGTDQGGGTWKATINSANHNNELGAYIVHTYTNNSGGSIFCDTASFTRVTPTNGSCGSANGKTYAYNITSYGSDTQCASGTSTNTAFPAQGSSTSWTCSGSNGGSSANCSASRAAAPVNGVCGSANLRTYPATATNYGAYTQCASGTSTNTAFPAQGSSTSWTCSGSNGGSSANCSASRAAAPTNGSCGSANGKTYAYNITSYGSDTQCASGTSTNTAFPAQGSSTSWTCSGSNGGSSANCSASRAAAPVNGVCGSSNNQNFTSAPTANFCSLGTASAISGSGPWTWTCNGSNGGSTANCSANKITNGLCGTSESGIYSIAPTTGLCSVGAASSAIWNGSSWAWTCRSCDGGFADLCYAYKSSIPVCGSSHGLNLYSAPTTNLCSIGTAGIVTGNGPWAWTCNNGSGIPITSCSANNMQGTCYFCCH